MASTITSVNSSTSSQVLVAADGSRTSMTVQNTDANEMFIGASSAVSTTSYAYRAVYGNGFNFSAPESKQAWWVIWDADGAGAAVVTAITDVSSTGTFGALKTRLLAEIKRPTMTSEASSHLLRAIEYYANRRTWKNEGTNTITTTASTATKAVPTGLRHVDRVAVVVGGYDYELDKITREVMADRQGADTGAGQPVEYSWEDTVLKFWPIPDAAYTVNVTGLYDDTALSDDADSSSWTDIGANLIIARAKYTICRDVTLDTEMMALAQMAERSERSRLFGETNARTASGRVWAGW
jgi:hypothetical protein